MLESITATELKSLPVIGKGMFTKCRRLNDSYVLLQTSDPLKECYSTGWLNSNFFPRFTRVNCEDLDVFACKRYDTASSLKHTLRPSHYKMYQTLRDAFKSSDNNTVPEIIKFLQNSKCSKTVINMLQETADVFYNYASYDDLRFEISPRNVAVDGDRLVLLDCFYSVDALKAARKVKEERRESRQRWRR